MIIGPLFPLTKCPQHWTVFLEGEQGTDDHAGSRLRPGVCFACTGGQSFWLSVWKISSIAPGRSSWPKSG